MTTRLISFLAVLTISIASTAASDSPSIWFEKATFKASFVEHGEKVSRVRLSTDAESVTKPPTDPVMSIDPSDAISIQASFADAQGQAVAPEQLFLRFLNKHTQKDNLFLVPRRGLAAKLDLTLAKEIKADPDFWLPQHDFSVQLIMGDSKLAHSCSWIISHSMRFLNTDHHVFQPKPRGVFDFDVSVKKLPQPEFDSPIPAPQKRASLPIILVAVIVVALPLPLLLLAWAAMGVLPVSLPSGDDKTSVLAFEACVLAHMVALLMFWLKWNIVTTWKVMAVIMIPTLLLGRSVVSGASKRR